MKKADIKQDSDVFGSCKLDYIDAQRRMYGLPKEIGDQTVFEKARENYYKANNIPVNREIMNKFLDRLDSPEIAKFDEYAEEIVSIVKNYLNIVEKRSHEIKNDQEIEQLYASVKTYIGSINEMAMHLRKSDYMIGGYVFGGKDRSVDIGFDKNISMFLMVWGMIPEEVKNGLFNLIKITIEKMVKQLKD